MLGYGSIRNSGESLVGGDVGVWPGDTVTSAGFNYAHDGNLHVSDDFAEQAVIDMTVGYLSARNRKFPQPMSLLEHVALSDHVFLCGIYKIDGDLRINGTVYLDGNNNPDSVFIFQIGGNLIVEPDSEIVVMNGASALNVFWQTGGSATLGSYSLFRGTILSFCRILLDEGVNMHGRLLADNRYMITYVVENGLYNPGEESFGLPTSAPTSLWP